MNKEKGNDVLPAGLMSVKEIKAIRNKLPDNWKWNKVYELPYINSRTGHEFCLKHWALTAPDGKGPVCSLGLISHDYSSDKKHFMEDIPVQFVEKSLTIIDSLLAEIERLQANGTESKEGKLPIPDVSDTVCQYCGKSVKPVYDDELKTKICPACHAYRQTGR